VEVNVTGKDSGLLRHGNNYIRKSFLVKAPEIDAIGLSAAHAYESVFILPSSLTLV
jgi:hypothetical protein